MDHSAPKHILAINDDREILRLYTELLTDEGYLVSVDLIPATDVADVSAIAPDLIVLDLLTGAQDHGTAFVELLRSDPNTRNLPVLVCSAATDRLAVLASKLHELDCDVIPKPFDIDVFLAAIRARLGPADTPLSED